MTRAASFVQFTARCRVQLTPAQRVLALVAFDGMNTVDLDDGDRELAATIFGDVERIPPAARHVLCAVCGARAGKSYVLGALRILHLALTVDLGTLAPGELAAGVIVAPDLRLARQTLRYALGAAKSVPEMADVVVGDTSDGFTIDRGRGRLVSLECLPATRGGSALRGRSLVGAVLDEACFFRDEASVVNDAELFRAVAPRVLPGGQVVLASTPWAEGGLLFELFAENHGKPTSAIAAHAPTLLLRSDDRTRALVEREQKRDPDNAAREFGAEFMPAGSGLFFDAAAVDAAIDAERPATLPHDPTRRAAVGADFAFDRDSSAVVAVERDGDTYHVAEVLEERPTKGAPLVPSVTCSTFAGVAQRRGVGMIVADRHYRRSVEEHLQKSHVGLQPAPDGQKGKGETYVLARTLLREGKVEPPAHPRLVAQLKNIISRPLPGGGVSISSPRRTGSGHGDLVSALVLALWHAHRLGAKGPGHGSVRRRAAVNDNGTVDFDEVLRIAVLPEQGNRRGWRGGGY